MANDKLTIIVGWKPIESMWITFYNKHAELLITLLDLDNTGSEISPTTDFVYHQQAAVQSLLAPLGYCLQIITDKKQAP